MKQVGQFKIFKCLGENNAAILWTKESIQRSTAQWCSGVNWGCPLIINRRNVWLMMSFKNILAGGKLLTCLYQYSLIMNCCV